MYSILHAGRYVSSFGQFSPLNKIGLTYPFVYTWQHLFYLL